MAPLEFESIETELRTGAPRQVRFRAKPQVGRIALWIFVLNVALLICFNAVNDLSALKALMARGKPGTVTITRKHYTSGRSTSYYLDYTLEADGQVITDEESVSSSRYNYAYIGSTLPILYLPGRPEIHRFPPVDQARIQRATLMWSLGFVFFVGVLAGLLYACESAFRTQYRLLRYGEAVRAEITRCVPPVKGSKNQTYSIGYRYTVPTHGTQEGTASVSVKLGQWLAQRSHVTVLFDPQKIQTSRMYAALNTVELASTQQIHPCF